MKDFINERWRPILAHNGLADFNALWNLKVEWFEDPNHRRGGWSGVARCELDLPEGGTRVVFLKRQENHGTFSWRHPLRGMPTFQREFRKIMHYKACGIPSVEPVYFAMRTIGKDQRAILATEELTGFFSMQARAQQWLEGGAPARPIRLRYLRAVADLLARMHAKGIQHNCFFPKHVFTRMNPDGSVEARVIDLEKSRWRPGRLLSARRDLYSLTLQSLCWSRTDRLWFFKAYLGIERLTPYAKWLWRHVESRSLKKGRLHLPARHLAANRDGTN